ncbi:MAG: hypothetical protein HQM15_10430 [Deltaproteobacteria bacterium]|nr:hypothetical protein [Deltaproteobacteria bacterium]
MKFLAKYFFILLILFFSISSVLANDARCPGENEPPPPILKIDQSSLLKQLEQLKDTQGRVLWTTKDENKKELENIFESKPQKTKLEQFFQLLFLIQKQIPASYLPLEVQPPIITEVLLTAKVFTEPSFPKKITSVTLRQDDPNRSPLFKVQFGNSEVRFPLNQGRGFASWDQGLCQVAKELVFYPGFSFRVRNSRLNNNLVVENFDQVEIYGNFGSRGLFDIDLNYVELQKVEFIAGTDQGKVTAKVAQREFKENKHSALFKFVGSMIPNTAKQRIDW